MVLLGLFLNCYIKSLFCTFQPGCHVTFLMHFGNIRFFFFESPGSPGHVHQVSSRRAPPPAPLQLRPSATARRCWPAVPPSSALSLPLPPPAQPASLLPLRLSQPGLRRAAPCGIRALPRRDPSLTSPCWDAATFPAKLCLPWLYYVCVRRSPASRGRQRRRRETGSQSQDKEKAGRQRLAGLRSAHVRVPFLRRNTHRRPAAQRRSLGWRCGGKAPRPRHETTRSPLRISEPGRRRLRSRLAGVERGSERD